MKTNQASADYTLTFHWTTQKTFQSRSNNLIIPRPHALPVTQQQQQQQHIVCSIQYGVFGNLSPVHHHDANTQDSTGGQYQ